MNSQIYRGKTIHRRLVPREHTFSYPMYWLAVDLNELPALDRRVRCFGYNRRAFLSLHDRDYVTPNERAIRDKINRILEDSSIRTEIHRVTLITIPRVAGYVFNPVCFYICYGSDDELQVLVAEVRNTFGQKHLYVAQPESISGNPSGAVLFRFSKQFYVSPFLAVDGQYDLMLKQSGNYLSITINLHQQQQLVFTASMSGRGVPMSSLRLLSTVAGLPFFAFSVMFRIHWQAFILYFRKKISFHERPAPVHRATIPACRRSVWHRLRDWLIRRAGHRHKSQTDSSSFNYSKSES